MTAQTKLVTDISPQGRVISSEIQKSVFNRSYMTFMLALMSCCAIMGFTISQWYETQKQLKVTQETMATNQVYMASIQAELKRLPIDSQQIIKEAIQ